MRRLCGIAIAGIAISALAGCAGTTLSSEVSTFGDWPADRHPDTYAFERLPSQQIAPETQQRLEEAASGALQSAGFRPTEDAGTADVTVQLAARADAMYRSDLDDPLWNSGGLYRSRLEYATFGGFGGGFGFGHGFAIGFDEGLRRYAREVTVLIRDRKSGTALYEARATSDGLLPLTPALLRAMFQAALRPFPTREPQAIKVTTPLTR